MLTAEETAELRALHAKAYGREGQLSPEEGARLRELERRRRGVAAPAIAEVPDPSTGSGSGLVSEGVPDPSTGSGSGRAAEAMPSVAEEAGPSTGSGGGLSSGSGSGSGGGSGSGNTRRPRLRWLFAAAAAALAVGVGIGWSVWGQTRDAIALTDEQRNWQDEFAAEDEYDPGSFQALSEDAGVVVWLATQDDGDTTCVLMSNGDDSSAVCRPTESVLAEGMWSDLEVPTEEPRTFNVTSANLLFGADGRPAVAMNTFLNSLGGNAVYEPEEQRIADAIVERGYQQTSLWIVGYHEDHPVWMAWADDGGEQCLIYARDDQFSEVCAPFIDSEDGLTLNLEPEVAGALNVQLELRYLPSGMHYLTITAQPASANADAAPGDVIEFTVDDPTFDDLAFDDKTGE